MSTTPKTDCAENQVFYWKLYAAVATAAAVLAGTWAMTLTVRPARADDTSPSELHLIRMAVQEMAKDTRELRRTPAAVDELRKTCKK